MNVQIIPGWTQERISELVTLRMSGLTYKAIGVRMGISWRSAQTKGREVERILADLLSRKKRM